MQLYTGAAPSRIQCRGPPAAALGPAQSASGLGKLVPPLQDRNAGLAPCRLGPLGVDGDDDSAPPAPPSSDCDCAESYFTTSESGMFPSGHTGKHEYMGTQHVHKQ